ncbi:hypothetical protein AVEN_104858-1 [Araneus ventricosus]|uniref:Uncharacterized protein n=1 Tax=Araneus ventricosus TaxID=182803 RepID=A0A4Y2INT4_ARAVE|nr:hypothetical protein AVEN_104858-1 [Araneus ventricosus]
MYLEEILSPPRPPPRSSGMRRTPVRKTATASLSTSLSSSEFRLLLLHSFHTLDSILHLLLLFFLPFFLLFCPDRISSSAAFISTIMANSFSILSFIALVMGIHRKIQIPLLIPVLR